MRRKIERSKEGLKYFFYDDKHLILTMVLELRDDVVEILLQGELRSVVAHALQDDLIAMVTAGQNIILDFSGATYITPSIQHALQMTQHKIDALKKGTLLLRKLPENIYQELEQTGASEQLMIEE